MRRRNLVLAYLLLVGAPAVGLLCILHAGQRVKPPISVGGPWELDANFSALGSALCMDLLGRIKQPFFTISQSGPNLVFILNDAGRAPLPGVISGSTLTVGTEHSLAAANANGGCGDPRNFYLAGTVSKQGDQRTLTGILGFADCAQCAPLPFRAVRQASDTSGAR